MSHYLIICTVRTQGYEVSDVITKFYGQIDETKTTAHQKRTLEAIAKCRTAALGGHIDSCDQCGHIRVSYNSCRNRHCPKCQGVEKEMWVIQQEDALLPVAYFHVVFTIPHELNDLCLHHPGFMYDLLMKSAWHTINTLSKDPKWLGANPAATMVLHTWSQTLVLHPHVHCIVPNGGLTSNGSWQFPKKGNGNFLFPVVSMQNIFRAYFMSLLHQAILKGQIKPPDEVKSKASYYKWKDSLFTKKWVVYTKKPFSGADHVIKYLARYTHRVAITNHRIVDINEHSVTFSYKDYKDDAKQKLMTLTGVEFVRRFAMHIVPLGFRKVRQYGFMSNACRQKQIAKARKALGLAQKALLTKAERKVAAVERLFGISDPCRCHKCNKGLMVTLEVISPNKDPPTPLKKPIVIPI